MLFLWRKRATVFDDPTLLPDDPTWKPSYADIAQAKTLGPALKKVCVMTEARELRSEGYHSGIADYFSDKEPVVFPSYDWSNLGSDLWQSIRRVPLRPLRRCSSQI